MTHIEPWSFLAGIAVGVLVMVLLIQYFMKIGRQSR